MPADVTMIYRVRPDGSPQAEEVPVTSWRRNEARIESSAEAFRVDEPHGIGDVKCAMCALPVAGNAFTIHTLVFSDTEDTGNMFLPSGSVLIHAECVIPDTSELYAVIAFRVDASEV
jgi:hypothetical protein